MSTTDETAEMLLRSAKAADKRKRRAWLSRLIWYPVILGAIPVALLLIGSRSFTHDRRHERTRHDLFQIRSGVESYIHESGHIPMPDGISARPGGSSLLTNQRDGLAFLNLLHGDNPGSIRYVIFRNYRGRMKGGAMLDKDGERITALYDGWGNPYRIVLDTQGDGVLVAHRGRIKDTVRGKKYIIFSAGRDRELGTKDDIMSWNPTYVPPPPGWRWGILRVLIPWFQ